MVKNKLVIQIKNGKEKVGVNFTGVGKLKQDEQGRIFFNDKNPVFFDLISYEFNGPLYKNVTESRTKGENKVTGEEKTKKKGKAGKIIGGAIIGSLFTPLGSLVGAAAGAGSKGKSKTKKNLTTNINTLSKETHKQVEIPSTATIKLRNIQTNEEVNLLIVCDSLINAKLSNFTVKQFDTAEETSDGYITELKKLKELLDLDIITQEEFELKKTNLLDL